MTLNALNKIHANTYVLKKNECVIHYSIKIFHTFLIDDYH